MWKKIFIWSNLYIELSDHLLGDFPRGSNDNFIHIPHGQHIQNPLVEIQDWIPSALVTVHQLVIMQPQNQKTTQFLSFLQELHVTFVQDVEWSTNVHYFIRWLVLNKAHKITFASLLLQNWRILLVVLKSLFDKSDFSFV